LDAEKEMKRIFLPWVRKKKLQHRKILEKKSEEIFLNWSQGCLKEKFL